MSRTDQGTVKGEHKSSKTAIWTAVAIVGAAAGAFILAKKLVKGEKLMDADTLLKAADKAANNLDAILSAESRQTAS